MTRPFTGLACGTGNWDGLACDEAEATVHEVSSGSWMALGAWSQASGTITVMTFDPQPPAGVHVRLLAGHAASGRPVHEVLPGRPVESQIRATLGGARRGTTGNVGDSAAWPQLDCLPR